jgi:hypothetical protein
MSLLLPNLDQKCFIRNGSRIINGVCIADECHYTGGPDKGKVAPGIGRMAGVDGKTYWLETTKSGNNWEFGHG